MFYTQHPFFALKKRGYGVVMVNLEGNTSIVLQLRMFVFFVTQESCSIVLAVFSNNHFICLKGNPTK
jgi:hypothetical protein